MPDQAPKGKDAVTGAGDGGAFSKTAKGSNGGPGIGYGKQTESGSTADSKNTSSKTETGKKPGHDSASPKTDKGRSSKGKGSGEQDTGKKGKGNDTQDSGNSDTSEESKESQDNDTDGAETDGADTEGADERSDGSTPHGDGPSSVVGGIVARSRGEQEEPESGQPEECTSGGMGSSAAQPGAGGRRNCVPAGTHGIAPDDSSAPDAGASATATDRGTRSRTPIGNTVGQPGLGDEGLRGGDLPSLNPLDRNPVTNPGGP